MKNIANVSELYSMRRFTGWKLAVFHLKQQVEMTSDKMHTNSKLTQVSLLFAAVH